MAYTSVEDERAYQRAYKQRARQDPEKRAQMNARNRAWRARRSSTPEGREKVNAYSREYYRKTAERQAQTRRDRRELDKLLQKAEAAALEPTGSPGKELPPLPARPFVEAIYREIRRTNALYGINDPEHREANGGLKVVCERAGLQDRRLHDWKTGKARMVEFDVVDRALQRLGWLWWDVYNEDTVRLPILNVIRRNRRRTKRRNADSFWRSKPPLGYGDRGKIPDPHVEGYEVTDWDTLAWVEAAFTGETAPVPRRVRGTFGQTIEEYKAAKAQRRELAMV